MMLRSIPILEQLLLSSVHKPMDFFPTDRIAGSSLAVGMIYRTWCRALKELNSTQTLAIATMTI